MVEFERTECLSNSGVVAMFLITFNQIHKAGLGPAIT